MRLINTETLELHEFFESQVPSYAILSHTWDKEEITFQEMVSISPSTMVKAGYKKIQDTCKMAQSRGQQWVWIDTCCIDKSSSAELTESINSMYRWYQNAHECYAYLVDFAPGSLPQDELEKCRWFTRGFTLQELIAPKTVVFFDRDWNVIGGKKDEGILEIIVRTTGISELILAGSSPLGGSTIAERMLWASSRETTRPEDKAYCLLGIFEVNMPLVYGEGDNAFRRLQEEIIKRSNDLSIFAWGTPSNVESTKEESLTERQYLGPLARSPADFGALWECVGQTRGVKHIRDYRYKPSHYVIPEFILTNRGLNFRANLAAFEVSDSEERREPKPAFYAIFLGKASKSYAVLLEKVGPGLYVRLGVRIVKDLEYVAESGSSITNTILMDNKPLLDYGYIFSGTVSIRALSDLRLRVVHPLPHTHWDASKSLFFPPAVDHYHQQSYEIACAVVRLTHPKFAIRKESFFRLFVIIDFRITGEAGCPYTYIFGDDDLPEINSLTQPNHLPHDVFFPRFCSQLLDPVKKGPEYGRQQVIRHGTAEKPRRVTIGIKAGETDPPAEFDCPLGRIRPRRQYTVMLHATFEDNVDE